MAGRAKANSPNQIKITWGRFGAPANKAYMLYSMPQPFTHEEAEKAIAQLLAGEDEGWAYVAVPDPAGGPNSLIAVYDEEGEFVGYWK